MLASSQDVSQPQKKHQPTNHPKHHLKTGSPINIRSHPEDNIALATTLHQQEQEQSKQSVHSSLNPRNPTFSASNILSSLISPTDLI
jgi:hypothetical protein